MKHLRLNIPADEAIPLLPILAGTIAHMESRDYDLSDNDYHLMIGVMQSLKDRMQEAVLNQMSHSEITELTEKI